MVKDLGAAPGGRIPFARTTLCEEAVDAVTKVLNSGWLTTGPQVAAFEEEFARWVGAEHAVAVASCTAGLELSLRSLHLRPGAPVLVPTITFCGAVNAILHAGLRPVLVDADPETLMPDGRTAARAAADGTSDSASPAAMVALHYAGYPAPVEQVAVGRRPGPGPRGGGRGPRGRDDRRRAARGGTFRRHLLQLLRHQEPAPSARAAW